MGRRVEIGLGFIFATIAVSLQFKLRGNMNAKMCSVSNTAYVKIAQTYLLAHVDENKTQTL
jgi:hypothetical protein